MKDWTLRESETRKTLHCAAAAAAAKSLQLCPTLCDGSPAGSAAPGILEWVAISFSNA